MARQQKLNIYRGKRGGRRPGSGRKRIHSKGVAHRHREKVHHRHPMHINFKVVKGVSNLRNKTILKALKRAIVNARRMGLKVNQYSLQSNHVHLVVEAGSNHILTKGMRSLTITFAKRINGIFKREGKVQKERFHLHILRTLREVKNALRYVLNNHEKHTGKKGVDVYSAITIYLNTTNWLFSKAIKDVGFV